MLHLTGYAVSMEDLKRFRQVDSITAGHPENTLIRGVEVSTGPLGQVRACVFVSGWTCCAWRVCWVQRDGMTLIQ